MARSEVRKLKPEVNNAKLVVKNDARHNHRNKPRVAAKNKHNSNNVGSSEDRSSSGRIRNVNNDQNNNDPINSVNSKFVTTRNVNSVRNNNVRNS